MKTISKKEEIRLLELSKLRQEVANDIFVRAKEKILYPENAVTSELINKPMILFSDLEYILMTLGTSTPHIPNR